MDWNWNRISCDVPNSYWKWKRDRVPNSITRRTGAHGNRLVAVPVLFFGVPFFVSIVRFRIESARRARRRRRQPGSGEHEWSGLRGFAARCSICSNELQESWTGKKSMSGKNEKMEEGCCHRGVRRASHAIVPTKCVRV